MTAIQTLLQGSIDYAGLFPPAELDMRTALENYVRYSRGSSSWALGRFIVSVSRLDELERNLPSIPLRPLNVPWRFAALMGANIEVDARAINDFNRRHLSNGAAIDSVEMKASSEADIGRIIEIVPSTLQSYIEVPVDPDPSDLIHSIGRGGARAKVRTGGVTADAFPRGADLLRFIRATIDHAVPFKATAGLHHPVRATYRLTYAEKSPVGRMFGFLNLMLAVAFLRSGMDESEVLRVLEEEDSSAFQADDSGISWRRHKVDVEVLREARRLGIVSFGSCSFTEPIEDLQSLRLLGAAVPQT
ncbi:MAG TPA: hypothetical protein VFH26_03945 [Gemmatimonadales bacterium]|nr:hypothetical protein [Gemmatimonadales bacterium]